MAVTCQKMERSRSHIVASAQLDVFFFVYTLMLYIYYTDLYYEKSKSKLVPGGIYFSKNMDRGVQICHDRPSPRHARAAKPRAHVMIAHARRGSSTLD